MTFRPSIDWSDEFVNSTLWVLQVWVITAVSLLVVLVLVGRMTEWGRQFWRITGDYFKGGQSAPVWAVVGLLLLSAILVVRINVLLSYYANDLFSALQVTFQPDSARNTGIQGFWATIGLRGAGRVLCGAHAGRLVSDATVHHALANLVEPSLHRRLARRVRLLPRPVLAKADRQPRPAHPAGHRHRHRGRRGEPNNPVARLGTPLLFGAVESVCACPRSA